MALCLALSFVFVFVGIAQTQADKTVVCPVSGKEIKISEAKGSYEYKGTTYYFCCEPCKEKFVKEPEKYIQKKEEKTEATKCPMHSKEKSEETGKCEKMVVKKEIKIQMEKEGKSCCAMMSMMDMKDMEVQVENLDNGITVKITSKNADVVKKIQELSVKMKEMCAQKEECEKTEKKEETIKK